MNLQPEDDLIEGARRVLADRLPPGWTVERVEGQGAGESPGETLFRFTGGAAVSHGIALVEARSDFAAADVDRLLGGLTRRLRESLGSRVILLVSEYLSPRARELLAAEDISFVDLTGNVRLAMRTPAMYVEASGAARRGTRETSVPGLAGAKVGAVVRFLAEVTPPYGLKDIEQATGVSPGYLSRVLTRLAEDAVIERQPRGPVTAVDWPAMLRLRAQAVDVFEANTSRSYIAPNGARAIFDSLGASAVASSVVVTGSFAAVRVAPVTAPTLLLCYLRAVQRASRFDEVASALGLLPADEGADVVLLAPADESVVTRPRAEGPVLFVNLPQLVVDNLGGTGRMPAEGEAVLEWMQTDPTRWRYPSIEAFRRDTRP